MAKYGQGAFAAVGMLPGGFVCNHGLGANFKSWPLRCLRYCAESEETAARLLRKTEPRGPRRIWLLARERKDQYAAPHYHPVVGFRRRWRILRLRPLGFSRWRGYRFRNRTGDSPHRLHARDFPLSAKDYLLRPHRRIAI